METTENCFKNISKRRDNIKKKNYLRFDKIRRFEARFTR